MTDQTPTIPQTSFKSAAEALQDARDSAVAAEILRELEKHGIVIPENVENEVYQTVKKFPESNLGKTFQRQMDDAQQKASLRL